MVCLETLFNKNSDHIDLKSVTIDWFVYDTSF